MPPAKCRNRRHGHAVDPPAPALDLTRRQTLRRFSGRGVFLTEMSDKEMVLEQIRPLPEDAPLERLLEDVEVLAAIRRGEQAADAGRVRTHAEVKRLMEEWTAR